MEGAAVPAAEKPKPYTVGPLPGGQLPDVGTILSETFAEFGDNVGPYLLAGLGHFLVMIPVGVALVVVIYVVLFGGMFGTMIVGGIGAGLVGELLGEELGALAMLLASVLSVAVPLVLLFGILGLAGAALAPLHASLYRAVAAHQRGEKPLDLMSAFTSAHGGILPVMLVSFATSLLTVFLLMLCYVPALIVPIVFPFALSLVALGGLRPLEALSTAGRHASRNLQWYVLFGLLSVVGGMVAANVPVLGAAFMTAFHVRAYRHLFGDGPTPVVD